MTLGKPILIANLGNFYVLPGDIVSLLCNKQTLGRFTTDELKKMQLEIDGQLREIEANLNHQPERNNAINTSIAK